MAVIWENGFDGQSGTVSVTNSGFYGDPVSAVTAPAVYQQTQRRHGAGALALGSTTASGTVRIALPQAADGWSIRFYMRFVPGQLAGLWRPGSQIIVLSTASSNASNVLGYSLPDSVRDAMLNRWTRVEVTTSRETGARARFWWTAPDGGADDYDHEVVSTLAFLAEWLEFRSGATGAFQTFHLDSVAVGEGEWLGPYTVGTDLVARNSLDGPHGTAVTSTSTGNYGTPASSVLGPPTFSTDWAVTGSSALLTGSAAAQVRTVQWQFSPRRSQFSARWYFNVPTGGRMVATAGDLQVTVSPQEGTFAWTGGTLTTVATQLVNATVRAEILRVDYTTTLRLWWADPHSNGAPDFQQSTNSSTHAAAIILRFEGAGGGNPGSFVDAVEMRQGGWIGPLIVRSGPAIGALRVRGEADGRRGGDWPAEGYIIIRGEASGRVELPTAVTGRIIIRGEADGIARPSTATGGVVDAMWLGPLGLLREIAERGEWARTPTLGVEEHVALSGRVTSSRSRLAPRTTTLAWDRLLAEDADALEEMALVPSRADGTIAVIDPDAATGNLLTPEQSRGRPHAGAAPVAVEDLYSLAGSGAITVGLVDGVRHACTNNLQAGADVRWLHPYWGARGWPVMPGWSVYLTAQTAGGAPASVSRLWLTFRDHSGAVVSSAAGDPGSGAVEADAPAGAVTVTPHMITTSALSGLRLIGEARLTYAPQDDRRPLGNGSPVYTVTDFSDSPAWPYRSVSLTLREVRAHATR